MVTHHNLGGSDSIQWKCDSCSAGRRLLVSWEAPNTGRGQCIRHNSRDVVYPLNYFEYNSLFQRVKKRRGPPASRNAGSGRGRGRPRNYTTDFEQGHPSADTHTQKLRSKAHTPIFAGSPRPPASAWKKASSRKAFAMYYTALFVPWLPTNGDPTVKCCGLQSGEHYVKRMWDFAGVFRYMSGSTDPNTPAKFRARYRSFENITVNGSCAGIAKQVGQIFRKRSVTPWSLMRADDVPSAPQVASENEDHDLQALQAAEAIEAPAYERTTAPSPHLTDRIIYKEKLIASFEDLIMTSSSNHGIGSLGVTFSSQQNFELPSRQAVELSPEEAAHVTQTLQNKRLDDNSEQPAQHPVEGKLMDSSQSSWKNCT